MLKDFRPGFMGNAITCLITGQRLRSPYLLLETIGRSNLNDQEFLRRLRKLIGHHCHHLGQHCTLIEILAEEAMIILRCEGGTTPIQADQFGQPFRRAAETRQIPLLDEDGENLSAELLDLLATFETDPR